MAGRAESADAISRPICNYCGGFIDKPGQQCLALDEGRCSP